jgi:hypothetical protein
VSPVPQHLGLASKRDWDQLKGAVTGYRRAPSDASPDGLSRAGTLVASAALPPDRDREPDGYQVRCVPAVNPRFPLNAHSRSTRRGDRPAVRLVPSADAGLGAGVDVHS